MHFCNLFDTSVLLTSPPPGCVNVRIGNAVEGPGGRWIPCVSEDADGGYVSCVFEVGPGRRQVCAAIQPTNCENDAFARALELATTAAG